MNRTAAPLVVACLLVAGCGSVVVSDPGASVTAASPSSAPSSSLEVLPAPECADDPTGPDLIHASTGPDGASPRRLAGQDDELDVLDLVEREFSSGDGLVSLWIDSDAQQVGVVWFGLLPEGLQTIEDSTADVDLVVHSSDVSPGELEAAIDRLFAAYFEPGEDIASLEVDPVSVSECNDGSGVRLTVAEDSVPGGAVPDDLVARVQAVAAPVPVLVATGSRIVAVAGG